MPDPDQITIIGNILPINEVGGLQNPSEDDVVIVTNNDTNISYRSTVKNLRGLSNLPNLPSDILSDDVIIVIRNNSLYKTTYNNIHRSKEYNVNVSAGENFPIPHNLNEYPNVIVIRNDGSKVNTGITYTDKNNISVAFPDDFIGVIVLH